MRNNEKVGTYRSSVIMPGSRVGVLLLHSLGGSPLELRPLTLGFARAGYTVHCPVLPGLADGTDLGSESCWRDWYATAVRAHDEIKTQCDVVIVGGLSVGALLAVHLAADRPDSTQGLMIFAPTMWPNGWAIPWYFNFFRLVRSRWFARLFRFRLGPPYGVKDDRLRKILTDTTLNGDRSANELFCRSGGVVLEVQRLARTVTRLLPIIRQHAVIFHPRHDDQSDLSTTWRLQRRLGGLVEMFVLDDSHHLVTLDRQRVFVTDRAVDYASRLVQRLAQSQSAARAPHRVASD